MGRHGGVLDTSKELLRDGVRQGAGRAPGQLDGRSRLSQLLGDGRELLCGRSHGGHGSSREVGGGLRVAFELVCARLGSSDARGEGVSSLGKRARCLVQGGCLGLEGRDAALEAALPLRDLPEGLGELGRAQHELVHGVLQRAQRVLEFARVEVGGVKV